MSIAADLKTLATQGKLPPVWQDIQKVDWSSDASNTLFEYNAPTFPVALNMQGNKTLNILCVQWVDYPQYGALVRYSLLDEKQNLVFELNRHYKIGFIY